MNQATAFEIIGDRCLWDLTCWAHRESRRGETLLLTNTVTVEVISPLGANVFMEATFIFKKSSIVAISNLLLLVQKSHDNCVYIKKKNSTSNASHFCLIKNYGSGGCKLRHRNSLERHGEHTKYTLLQNSRYTCSILVLLLALTLLTNIIWHTIQYIFFII